MRTTATVPIAALVALALAIILSLALNARYARYSVVKCDEYQCTMLDRWTGIVYLQAVPIRK